MAKSVLEKKYDAAVRAFHPFQEEGVTICTFALSNFLIGFLGSYELGMKAQREGGVTEMTTTGGAHVFERFHRENDITEALVGGPIHWPDETLVKTYRGLYDKCYGDIAWAHPHSANVLRSRIPAGLHDNNPWNVTVGDLVFYIYHHKGWWSDHATFGVKAATVLREGECLIRLHT